MGPAVILNTTVMARGIQLRSAERPRHRDMHGTHAAHMYAHDCGLPASLTAMPSACLSAVSRPAADAGPRLSRAAQAAAATVLDAGPVRRPHDPAC